ncbi:MAG TPA: DNA polymerase III subunit alpha [Hydrogenophaga sp.]|jgi:DNA polymerase-3 subunit alpha|uniref:DNA polymerase III subunit alpha n=2 Tax=Hydrogenophaga sp. TaxID=1904254 RepID=UPI0008CB04EC|nr:DNA polymerase III subunit alpha [Hydrogenophaga sp.]MBU4180739.1 DNA polymerase III subunit alpha [Gammaproteobacteria bacterium]OGA78839.1 MAG: DNA polymerase III subunit alpha [Burkholderiales bacterium GWE1_65_30]OGA89409.1 MAG: DNA polymerase III subunit alpha [Burkholderiales bacterium GWF1_66_17]MBU4281546.1 DNA polymerase III subunit alpha [Gammaproteobacteria bacterium]MBU4322053.1 DNA polymerase III subunit alpha [Gammaproteobacteria bacterium]
MFIHLRLHTEFSVVDGTNRIDDVVAAAAADGQPALAITDLSNLFGAVKFYKAARGEGVKPLLGAEVMLQGFTEETPNAMPGSHQPAAPRVILLVQDKQGYLNLSELLARAWTRSDGRGGALVQREWLEELNGGLLMLSGAQAGPVGQALIQGDANRAADVALKLAGLFTHRFYIELQRAGRVDDERHVTAAVQLAARLHLPVVATHPVQFLEPDDYEAHEARVCISDGEILGNNRRVRRFTREQYFKSAAQMEALFADIPSAVANTLEIAKRCSLTLVLGKPQLPNFPIPPVDGVIMSVEDYFRHVSYEGLEGRLKHLFPDEAKREAVRARYVERLEFELNTILKMGFPGYFLIVSDFIKWAKENGCPVGPGRGSGAGSLVAYALLITDLDPLQYNLLFERFLNPERVSMPDFDIDFCQSNRDRVIDYVKDRYGKDAVSQIATFGTMAARAAIRDVGRVLDFSYGFCDGISKLIPNKPGMSVTLQYPPNPKPEGDKNNYAIEMEPVLAERIQKEDDVKTLIELAQKLEGMTRNIGMHAGGVLIAPGKLTDFCPLYMQPGSDSAVSQYDKDDVEAIGLVKFDFLGLATLTILEIAREFIMKRHKGQENFRFEDIPLDDQRVYALFSRGQTEAVFQFESRGMQGMLKDAKPSRLEDLIALNALYRPGPMDLIPSFVARKHGREVIEYPHPLVAEMLSETYGIMVYQEQVMQTAQILGGYSLGGADMLRRAMGKKKAEEMAEHRAIFRAGAARNDISEAKADEVFDLMEKFAGYGFNKSHAAAYSLLAYHTGWLKVHYTAEFFCANMTVEMDDTDKLKVLWEDAKKMGISFEAPDVNRGFHRFEPITDKSIRYGLGAIKGTGQQAIDAIVAAREGRGEGPNGAETGPFKSLFDFCRRVDRQRLNKRTVEALIKAGAFDSLHLNRAEVLASVEVAFDFAAASVANANQGGLFDMMGEDDHGSSTQEPDLVSTTPWGVKEQLTLEKTALGFYFSGHLFDEVQREVRRFARTELGDVKESRDPVILAGIVTDFRIINGQRGKLALFKIDDKTAVLEVSADENLINLHRNLLKDDELIVVQAVAQPDRFSGGLRLKIQQIWDLAAARCRFGKFLRVAVNGTAPAVATLVREFPPKRELTDQGELVRGLPVRLALQRAGAQCELQLDDRALFFPTDAALASWTAQAHERRAEIVFD